MPLPNPYEIRLQRAKAIDDRRHITDMAEVGAQQLSQYGEEGNAWAKRLRENPRAAMKMAAGFGGFGEIENSLRYGMAAKTAGMSDIGTAALRAEGAKGYGDFATGKKSLAEAQGTEMINRYMQGSSVPGQAGQTGAADAPPAVAGLDAIKMGLALKSGDPEKIRKAERGIKYGSAWSPTELDSIRKERKKELGGLPDLVDMREDWKSYDPKTRLGAFGLMQIWQRNADPGAVVRGEDVKLLTAVGASTVEEMLATLGRITDKDSMPEGLGQLFKDSVDSQLVAREGRYLRMSDQMYQFADDAGMNDAAKNRSIPYRSQIGALRKRREKALGAPTMQNVTLEEAKANEANFSNGDLVSIDGVPGEIIGGKWKKAE